MAFYLLIDGNSIGHAANSGTVLTVGQTQVQAIFGFMRTIRRLHATYPTHKVIVLWDGASWRKMLLASYKENRDKADKGYERKLLAAKEIFKKQAGAIEKGLSLLGVDQLRATNMEADDLAAILTDLYTGRGHSVSLITADKDWIQLVGERCVWVDPIHDRKITLRNFEEMTGVKTARSFVEMKALSGDAGDNVPGVGGVGAKGAKEFLESYGSFANFSNLALDPTFDVKGLPKKYRDLALDEGKRIAFARNMDLVDLRTSARPAPINMNLNRGEPSQERFGAFCRALMFKSILDDLSGWLSVFPAFQLEQAA